MVLVMGRGAVMERGLMSGGVERWMHGRPAKTRSCIAIYKTRLLRCRDIYVWYLGRGFMNRVCIKRCSINKVEGERYSAKLWLLESRIKSVC